MVKSDRTLPIKLMANLTRSSYADLKKSKVTKLDKMTQDGVVGNYPNVSAKYLMHRYSKPER